MSNKVIVKEYQPSIGHYAGNPFIEALPPILDTPDIIKALRGKVNFDITDQSLPASQRIHLIPQLLNIFFHPIERHIELWTKFSIMLRQGYVGRNISNGELNKHIQNGYERTMKGDISAFRYEPARSTAQSMSIIGCSGIGKTTTINNILSVYPQVIYHEKYNFTQIVYLKIDCPHDGSLKSLCLHFFRAVDIALDTNYEAKYALKRHGVETLLNLMRQIANFHAIGLLIIDEIQHLNIKNSGGADKMLNFFVTLVNVISLPVIMVGTPKARYIFNDLRGNRRAAGFGSVLWEPIKNEPNLELNNRIYKSEWNAFTDALWKYQWLNKADMHLSDEIRECLYDLSQGILDIAVKLFVLAQISAITSGLERITIKLLKKTYHDELKPIHPMVNALRSKDPEKIIQFSDLIIPEVDQQILKLQMIVDKHTESTEYDDLSEYNGNKEAIRLHHLLLGLDFKSELLVPTIKRAFQQHPHLSMQELMPVVMIWLNDIGKNIQTKPKPKNKSKGVKQDQWHTLDTEDLRFQFSQKDEKQNFYQHLKEHTQLIFNMERWFEQVS